MFPSSSLRTGCAIRASLCMHCQRERTSQPLPRPSGQVVHRNKAVPQTRPTHTFHFPCQQSTSQYLIETWPHTILHNPSAPAESSFHPTSPFHLGFSCIIAQVPPTTRIPALDQVRSTRRVLVEHSYSARVLSLSSHQRRQVRERPSSSAPVSSISPGIDVHFLHAPNDRGSRATGKGKRSSVFELGFPITPER